MVYCIPPLVSVHAHSLVYTVHMVYLYISLGSIILSKISMFREGDDHDRVRRLQRSTPRKGFKSTRVICSNLY